MAWIPTAKQARDEADRHYLGMVSESIVELVDLLGDIEFAANNGSREFLVRYGVTQLTELALINLGYKTLVIRGLTLMTIISW